MAASQLVDLVKVNVLNTGTGALTLGTAVGGYRGIEPLQNGATYSYSIQQGETFEVGKGMYLASGHQFVRSPLYSSSGNAAINLQPNAQLALVALADDILARDVLQPLYGYGAPLSGQGLPGQTYFDLNNPVTLYGPKTGAGWGVGVSLQGDAGLNGQTVTDLAGLKAVSIITTTPPTNLNGAWYFWTAGNFTGQADDVNIVKANGAALSSGAWVRQTPNFLSYKRTESNSVYRTATQVIDSLPATPEQFGAVGDGVTDDTVALQRAVNSGKSLRKTPGAKYLVKSRLAANVANVSYDLDIKVGSPWDFASDTDGGGTHLRVWFVTADNVAFRNCTMDATGVTAGTAVENGFIWSTALNTSIIGCQFIGLIKGTCTWALGNAPYFSFQDNRVFNCAGAAFSKGRSSILSGNTIINATDAALVLNGTTASGGIVSGNLISNEAGNILPSMIALEEQPSDAVVVGNTLLGAIGAGIVCTSVVDMASVSKGVIISANSINGAKFDGTLVNTGATSSINLVIQPLYTNWLAEGNSIKGVSPGTASSCLALLSSTNGVFRDNILDASATTGIATAILIAPGAGGITIGNNRSTVAAGVRHYLFSGGSYGSVTVAFRGNETYGGAEGINAEQAIGSISNLKLTVENPGDNTATSFINAGTMWGDRSDFLNAGAWARRPCIVGPRTNMFCNAAPSAPGSVPFMQGDTFKTMNPPTSGAAVAEYQFVSGTTFRQIAYA